MIEGAVVAVHGLRGLAVGCLIDDHHVITCAHVLDPAMGPAPPTCEPVVSFPLVAPAGTLKTTIVHWQPQSNIDLVVLRLKSDPPSGAQPAPVADDTRLQPDLWGRVVHFFGFPADVGADGIWSQAELKGRQAQGWLQLEDERARGYFVEPGFSGTPLWDPDAKVVRGIVLARDPKGSLRVGYAVPISALLLIAPMLRPRRASAVASTLMTPRDPPRPFRRLLDRVCPRLHAWLTDSQLLDEPPGRMVTHEYLRRVQGQMTDRSAHYLPLSGRTVPSQTQPKMLEQHWPQRELTRIVRQRIRMFASGIAGEDAGSAQIALMNRRSKLVRNLRSMLLRSQSPLVLLGDPGTGKSMTLREVARAITEQEQQRVFPRVPIFIRLGNLQLPQNAVTADVRDYVLGQIPASLREFWVELLERRRLVILFDGMDEMNRARYVEYVRVLSAFASEYGDRVKILFSCRINDFSPELRHRQLVVMPFSKAQIELYLRTAIEFPLTISDRLYTARELSDKLIRGDLPIEPSNPMNLFLLADYLYRKESFPNNRAELFASYIEEAFRRLEEGQSQSLPARLDAFRLWAYLGFEITRRNEGALIDSLVVDGLLANLFLPAAGREARTDAGQSPMIASGLRCGVLVEELRPDGVSLRFGHHRLQEYFTARHLASSNDLIDWNSALDVPRWQETVINLVAMGNGEIAVRSLTSLIDSKVTSLVSARVDKGDVPPAEGKSDSPPPDPRQLRERAQEERLLAERVELAARIARERRPELTVVDTVLRPVLEKAATELTRNGNPSSQVRMLWAGRVLEPEQFATFVNELSSSSLAWVRMQALVAASDSDGALKTIGSDVPFEIGRDVGAAQFVERAWTYLSFIGRRPRIRDVWAFGAGMVAQVIYTLLLAATITGGAMLALWLSRPGTVSPADFFTWSGSIYMVCPVVALATGAIRDWRFLPHWTAGGVVVSCVWAELTQIISGMSNTGGALVQSILTMGLGVMFVPVLVAIVCTASLLIYLVLSGQFLRWTKTTRALKLMFAARAGEGLFILFLIGGGIALFFGTFVAVDVLNGMESNVEFAGLSMDPDTVAGGILITVLGSTMGPGLVLGIIEKIREQKGIWPFFRWVIKGTPGMLLVLVVAILVSGVLMFFLDIVFDWIAEKRIDQFALKGAYWLIGLILLCVAGYFLIQLSLRAWKILIRRTYWRQLLPIDDWRAEFKNGDGIEQTELLESADAQAFGLTSVELLDVLVEIEPAVKVGQALDKYWSVRYQLEQAAKQERAA